MRLFGAGSDVVLRLGYERADSKHEITTLGLAFRRGPVFRHGIGLKLASSVGRLWFIYSHSVLSNSTFQRLDNQEQELFSHSLTF